MQKQFMFPCLDIRLANPVLSSMITSEQTTLIVSKYCFDKQILDATVIKNPVGKSIDDVISNKKWNLKPLLNVIILFCCKF